MRHLTSVSTSSEYHYTERSKGKIFFHSSMQSEKLVAEKSKDIHAVSGKAQVPVLVSWINEEERKKKSS